MWKQITWCPIPGKLLLNLTETLSMWVRSNNSICFIELWGLYLDNMQSAQQRAWNRGLLTKGEILLLKSMHARSLQSHNSSHNQSVIWCQALCVPRHDNRLFICEVFIRRHFQSKAEEVARWGPDQSRKNCASSWFFLKGQAGMNLQRWLLCLKVIYEAGPPHTTAFGGSPISNPERSWKWIPTNSAHSQTASLGKLSLVASKVTVILNTHLAHLEKKSLKGFQSELVSSREKRGDEVICE